MNKLFNHFVDIAVPAANGKPIVKGFKGIIVLNGKPMEFEVVSDVVSQNTYFDENEDLQFSMQIKTPYGIAKMFYVPFHKFADVYFSNGRLGCSIQATYIYMTDDDFVNDEIADLGLKIYETPLIVSADSIESRNSHHNVFNVSGYKIKNAKIVKSIHTLHSFCINGNCEISQFDGACLDDMYGDLSEVTHHLLEIKELAKLKKKMDIVRLEKQS